MLATCYMTLTVFLSVQKINCQFLSIANQPITTFYYFFTYSSQLWIKLDTLFLFGNIDWATMTMTSQQ